jgi:hypothetical protein
MAKRFPPVDNSSMKYYAYYDPVTYDVFLVTNEPHPVHEHYALITKDQHADITSHKVKFHECIIDRRINLDNTVDTQLITQQTYDEFNFKSKSLTWITDPSTTDTEFVIDYSKTEKQWEFTITDTGRQNLTGSRYDATLVVFVTLENDFDFLIRTFYLRIHDLLKSDVLRYSFESTLESQIEKLSISTRIFFNSYGLNIND